MKYEVKKEIGTFTFEVKEPYISTCNATSQITVTFTATDGEKVEAFSNHHDLITNEGKKTFHFDTYNKIGGKLINMSGKKKKWIYIPLPDEVYDGIQAEHEENMKKLRESALQKAQNLTIARFWEGGDTGKLFLRASKEEISDLEIASLGRQTLSDCPEETLLDFLKDCERCLQFHEVKLAAETNNTITIAKLKELMQPIVAKRLAKRKKAEEEKRAKFDDAAKTNNPVVLYTYTVDCNDPEQACDIDTITVFAMPDGSIKKRRDHNW